jgi:hypothetical protein
MGRAGPQAVAAQESSGLRAPQTARLPLRLGLPLPVALTHAHFVGH